jgi:hypothetical protein
VLRGAFAMGKERDDLTRPFGFTPNFRAAASTGADALSPVALPALASTSGALLAGASPSKALAIAAARLDYARDGEVLVVTDQCDKADHPMGCSADG